MATSQEVSGMRWRGRGGGFTVDEDTTRTIDDGSKFSVPGQGKLRATPVLIRFVLCDAE
jgi:hypothetical protein